MDIHTAILNSTNTLAEVRPLASLAIAAILGLLRIEVMKILRHSGCLS